MVLPLRSGCPPELHIRLAPSPIALRAGVQPFLVSFLLPICDKLRLSAVKIPSPAFDKLRACMHGACMATKTISIDLVAYEALTKARKSPGESFSQVIRRATWDTRSPATGSELLEMLKDSPSGPPDLVETLNANQALDTPPRDPWDE